MKYILILFAVFIGVSAKAQNYGDSSITLTLTQRTAYWVGQYIRVSFQWNERNAPTQLQPYIGSGNAPDSLLGTVQLKAKYILGAMDALISQPLSVSYTDYRKIMMNQPSTPGYTALITQVNTKANNINDPQHLVAQWLSEQYQARTAAFENLYNEQKTNVIIWSRD